MKKHAPVSIHLSADALEVLFYVDGYFPACMSVYHMPVWQSGRPEKVYDPIEMVSHSQLRGLGIESRSSERATTAFIH